MMPAAGNKQVRPLQGGIRIEGKPTTETVRSGTIGLVIDKEPDGAQRARFVTAGHILGDPDTLVGQPEKAIVVGRVQENHLAAGVDIAVVRTAAGVPAEVGRVWIDDGAHITVQFAKDVLPADGAPVVLQGAVSGNVTGKVLHANAQVTESTTGEILKNVVLVDYGDAITTPGDSGAPILSNLQEGALCYGVHGGTVKLDGGRSVGWFTPFDNLDW